ncbi:hypothetical protein D6833_06180 [Candidatus Parcubacteria bacterium]|nr:MAG: hypothetical protein D6833_06180 [Candidatus Parcubacteria bacterium]
MEVPRDNATVLVCESGQWVHVTDHRFAYDEWNPIARFNPSTSLTLEHSYTRGLDLRGTLQRAGEIGGLLARTVASTLAASRSTSYYHADGNRNVMALVSASDGTVSAQYEYGPFAEPLRATGPMAQENPFRFSTKYQDRETGLYYYGYRYYQPSTGRWYSPDPTWESGGLNVYAVSGNNAIDFLDILGLRTAYTIRGPEAAVVAWIAPFDPTTVDPKPFFIAYLQLTKNKHMGYREFREKPFQTLFILAGSANAAPGDPPDFSTKETRGWLRFQLELVCGCDDQVRSWRFTSGTSHGFTPVDTLLGRKSFPGDGTEQIHCDNMGGAVHCFALERSRIGDIGRWLFNNIFPGVGVPYRWSKIDYILRCDITYAIYFHTSDFPSHRPYLDGRAVHTFPQKSLPAFLFAGDGKDAPGTGFHVETGFVP